MCEYRSVVSFASIRGQMQPSQKGGSHSARRSDGQRTEGSGATSIILVAMTAKARRCSTLLGSCRTADAARISAGWIRRAVKPYRAHVHCRSMPSEEMCQLLRWTDDSQRTRNVSSARVSGTQIYRITYLDINYIWFSAYKYI